MAGRISLVEQKRIQWAKEREEMARLGGSWGLIKNTSTRTTIRTYPAGGKLSLAEMKDKQSASSQPFRATGHYGSTVSLKSLATVNTGNGSTSLKCLDFSGSLINLHDQPDMLQIRRRSPSLPPIYNKDQQQYICQEQQQRDLGVEGLRYSTEKPERSGGGRQEDQKDYYRSPGEEREGETSGYASDSVDVPVPSAARKTDLHDLVACKRNGTEMTEKTWQNPYYTTPESSLPPSRRLSDGRMGELNRPRWGSVWGQESVRGDPPPPSWLSRLGHSSQVLVINHDSASSPDSSTTGSAGSETNKTYLRGHNIPVDADVLQEREAKRQKALELQNAIKQQLEEKERQRKEERERRLREERLEEERIKREQEREKERFEEEQRRMKEKEAVKLKQAEAMREVLQAAERLAKEEKRCRRKREEVREERIESSRNCESRTLNDNREQTCPSVNTQFSMDHREDTNETRNNDDAACPKKENTHEEKPDRPDKMEEGTRDVKAVQVPISKDVAIVLSGRLEDSDVLSKANLQLLNLVVSPSPRKLEVGPNNLSMGLTTLMSMSGPMMARNSSPISPRLVENRILTPSKYRMGNGRDFGTQTDLENDLRDLREKMQDTMIKDGSVKERKDTTNASRRDVDKSTNMGSEENSIKNTSRSKSQPRTSLDSRPRWNANRPGTRYRTQSEKDPHYQRRLRLRRRQVESSDERSRSPSPDRAKLSNAKSKPRNIGRRKVKLDSYDADLSMDSLNSIVPLRIDKNGRINLEDNKCERNERPCLDNDRVNEADRIKNLENPNSDVWCGKEILSKLSSLRNGLLMKQIEWDSERCLVSPAASEMY